MTARGLRTALAAAAMSASLLPAAAGHAATAEEQPTCDVAAVPGSEVLGSAKTRSNPVHERLHVPEAHELVRGAGTTVAVIDSGVVPPENMQGALLHEASGVSPDVKSGHGTIVAGLIAGPDGVAPGAAIFDVRVFDAEGIDQSEGRPVTSAGIAEGVRAVTAAIRGGQAIDVVNISLAVRSNDPVLEQAVAELVALDTVVVAAAGNRDPAVDAEFSGTAGSDGEVYPADYPGVLAVSATPPAGEDPAAYVTPNADTDVAAPTHGAVSVNATGQRCVVEGTATSWAAAEVSGLVALLRQRFPDETPRQVVARLEATTEGAGVQAVGGKAANPWTGAGVVQAHDALTREIEPGRQGRLEVSRPAVGADAVVPPPPERIDLFGPSRTLLLWTGLLAGALLALAFILRPLLRR